MIDGKDYRKFDVIDNKSSARKGKKLRQKG